MIPRKPYPSDVSDEEWAFVAVYVTLLPEDAGQRRHEVREVSNGLNGMVRTGATWRMMPHDLPPWHVVYEQTRAVVGGWLCARRWSKMCVCWCAGSKAGKDSPVLPSSTAEPSTRPASRGGHAGSDGATRRKGSKVHGAGETLGHLLALLVTPANEQDRAHVGTLAQAVQEATGHAVEIACVDQGYTGDAPNQAALEQAIQWEVVKLPEAKHGVVLLPRRSRGGAILREDALGSVVWHVIMSGFRPPSLAFISLPLLVSCAHQFIHYNLSP